MTTGKSNQSVLWIAAIGLLLLIACGLTSNDDAAVIAQNKATMEAMATAIAAEKNELQATSTLEPTPLPPTTTPTPLSSPTATSTSPARESVGDTLTNPTPALEGIILFLSSRDHSRTEEEIRDHSGAHDLELYAMRPDGSQQTRLSDGTLELTNYPPLL